MLKPLRYPTSFVLLSIALCAWLYATTLQSPSALATRRGIDKFATLLLTHDPAPKSTYFQFPQVSAAYPSGRVLPLKSYVAIYEVGSEIEVRQSSWQPGLPKLSGQDPVATIQTDITIAEAWGLGLPFFTRTLSEHTLTYTRSDALIRDEILLDAARASGILPATTSVAVDWPFALHDTALTLTPVAWLYALLTIPTWKLWRNLTPAQRRRQRHACQSCGYDRSATPDKPCPECGTALPIP
ncbi:MAG: hypothetical protein AAFR96_10690 [Planctomycetota bacterium]